MRRFFAYEGADQQERIRLRRAWAKSWKAGKKELEKKRWNDWYASPRSEAYKAKKKVQARERKQAKKEEVARKKVLAAKKKKDVVTVHSDDSDFAPN